MLDDLSTSVTSALRRRLTGFFTGALGVAWCSWNWRFLFVLAFEGGKATERLDTIEQLQLLADPLRLWVYPLLTALSVPLVLELLNLGGFWLRAYFHAARQNFEESAGKETLLSAEECLVLREHVRTLTSELRALKRRESEAVRDVQLLARHHEARATQLGLLCGALAALVRANMVSTFCVLVAECRNGPTVIEESDRRMRALGELASAGLASSDSPPPSSSLVTWTTERAGHHHEIELTSLGHAVLLRLEGRRAAGG